jgi:hypothetical protein
MEYRRMDFWAGLDKPILFNDEWVIPSHKGALFAFSTKILRPLSKRIFLQPLSSVCTDGNRLFVTGYMTGTLFSVSPDTLRIQDSYPTVRAPRFHRASWFLSLVIHRVPWLSIVLRDSLLLHLS